MDPHIARRLPNYMPMRVAELPDFEKIWDSLEAYIEFWAEIGRLVTTPSLFKWEVRSSFRQPEHTMSRLTGCRRRQDRPQQKYTRVIPPVTGSG